MASPPRVCVTCGKPTRRNIVKGLEASTECDTCYDIRAGADIECPFCGETKHVRRSVIREAKKKGDEPCCSKSCANARAIQRQRDAGVLTSRTDEEVEEYNRAYYLAHRDHIISHVRTWQEEHPELTASYKAKTRDRLRSDPEYYAMEKTMSVLSRHGLSRAEFDAMVIAQSGLCSICGAQLIRPCIDHCHAEGHIRGLLCGHCNTGLGMFKDDPVLLQRAIDYLLR